jgi:hypothetical protein
MTYTPPKRTVAGNRGPQGVSTILLRPDKPNLAKIVMSHTDKDTKEVTKEEYIIKLSEQEEKMKPFIRAGNWYVNLNSEKNKVYGIRPLTGIFKMQFLKIAASEDKEPAPRTNTQYKDPFDEWTVILRILDGDEKGMEVPINLRYWFVEEVKDGKSIVGYEFHPKSPDHMPRLMSFCDYFGVWDYGEMKYSDNILPEIQKRCLTAKKSVKVMMKNGWVDSFIEPEMKPDTE